MAVQAGLCRNPNCWFSHAQAQSMKVLKNDNKIVVARKRNWAERVPKGLREICRAGLSFTNP